jgi:hypothetical protein
MHRWRIAASPDEGTACEFNQGPDYRAETTGPRQTLQKPAVSLENSRHGTGQ